MHRVLALDEVVGDLLGHEVRLAARRLALGLDLSNAGGEPVRLPLRFLRLGLVRLDVRLLDETVHLPIKLLLLAVELGHRRRVDPPVSIIRREEHVVELRLEGVALRPRHNDDGGAPVVIDQVGDDLVIVPPLELAQVEDPTLLHDPAVRNPVVVVLGKPVDQAGERGLHRVGGVLVRLHERVGIALDRHVLPVLALRA